MATDDKKSKVISILKEVTPKRTRAKKAPAAPAQNINVSGGNGNAIGNNNTVHNISTAKVIHRPKVTVVPGHEVITEAQAVEIRSLVMEVGDLEKLHKKTPKSYAAIQNAANKKGGVTQYRLIPLDKFEVVKKYLWQWRGRLTGTKSAPKKDNAAWRNRQYAYIKINVKQLATESKLADLLQRKFSVDSITALDDTQLRSVYLSVAGWKQAGK